MGVVPGVEGELHPPAQVSGLDAGGGVHGDGRLVPHADLAVDVPGHVQPVAHAGGDLGVGRAAVEGVGGVGAVVPEVDAVVVRTRVLGRRRQHLLQHHVVGVAVLAEAVVGEERRRLDVLRDT